MEKNYFVYLLASKKRGTLYIGVTSDLIKRTYQHKAQIIPGFTKKYAVKQLVYFEKFNQIEHAIQREKRLKKWNREWKIKMIEEKNPDWEDLYEKII